MTNILLIGLGGFIGAILRYAVSGFVQDLSKSISFPYGTLVVNVVGCLCIGFLTQLAETRGVVTPPVRLFIFMGLLGAFTTFSTFGNETINLIIAGRINLAFLNIGSSLAFCLSAVWLGRIMASFIWR